MKSKSTTLKIIVLVVLVMLTCAYLLPIYVMLSNSLKTLPRSPSAPTWRFLESRNSKTSPSRCLAARIS